MDDAIDSLSRNPITQETSLKKSWQRKFGACQWLLLLSVAILGLSHLSAAAACQSPLSPDPYVVSSNPTSANLVQNSGCTLGSFTVGAGITLRSGEPSGSPNAPIIDNYGTITTITNNGTFSGRELISNRAGSTITTIINTRTMSSNIAAIRNQGVIALINNSNAMSSDGILVDYPGYIDGRTVRNTGTIIELNNTGTIVGATVGIDNTNVI